MIANLITGASMTTCNKPGTNLFNTFLARCGQGKVSIKLINHIYVRRDETYPSHNHKVGSTENNITKAEVFQGYRPMDW